MPSKSIEKEFSFFMRLSTKVLITNVCLLAASSLLPAFADEAALEAKIDKLEQKVENLEGKGAASDTTVGGYGEIAYNAYRKDSSRNEADLKRFVLFLGHRFSDRWSFNGEAEWEHA